MKPSINLDELLDAFAARVAAHLEGSEGERPRWRTLASEARRRGFPTARALRDWCRAAGVTVRGAGKHQVVCVADLDAALERMPVQQRATAPSDGAESAPSPSTPRTMNDSLAAAGLRVVPGAGKGAR